MAGSSSLPIDNISLVIDYIVPVSKFSLDYNFVLAGESLTATITEGDNTLSHAYLATMGDFSQSYEVELGEDGSFLATTISVPLEILYQMPSTSSEEMTLTLYTSSEDGTVLHETAQTVTVNCPTTVKPTIGTVSVEYINAVDGQLVKNISSVEISVTGSAGAMGSSIASVWINVGEESGSNPYTSGVLTSGGSITYTVNVTDTRGKSTLAMYFLEVQEYYAPTINSFVSERCDTDGTPNVKGTCAHAKVDFYYEADASITELSGVVRIKDSSLANWATVYEGTVTSGTWLVFTSMTFDIDKSYDIELTLSDSNGMSVTVTSGVGTAYVFMRWEPQSDVISFGCYPRSESTKCLQLAEDWSLFHGDENIYNIIYPTGCVVFRADTEHPSVTLGGMWTTVGSLTLGGNTITAWKKTAPILVG